MYRYATYYGSNRGLGSANPKGNRLQVSRFKAQKQERRGELHDAGCRLQGAGFKDQVTGFKAQGTRSGGERDTLPTNVEVANHLSRCTRHGGEVLLDCSPNYFEIDAEIIVNELVSHPKVPLDTSS